MKIIALPLLFNGLFFSISPSAVYKKPACNEHISPAYVYTVPTAAIKNTVCSGPADSCKQQLVKVHVHFYMNDKKEMQVISVDSPVPSINSLVLQNLSLLMPEMRNYFSVNQDYSITLELACEQLS